MQTLSVQGFDVSAETCYCIFHVVIRTECRLIEDRSTRLTYFSHLAELFMLLLLSYLSLDRNSFVKSLLKDHSHLLSWRLISVERKYGGNTPIKLPFGLCTRNNTCVPY